MEGAKYRGMIVGYGATSVEVPERSPFSLADLMVLAYIIEHYRAGEWTRFDYARVCDELWYARVGDRATLRGRLRLLRKYGLIETKTVGVKGERGVRTFTKVNMSMFSFPGGFHGTYRIDDMLQC